MYFFQADKNEMKILKMELYCQNNSSEDLSDAGNAVSRPSFMRNDKGKAKEEGVFNLFGLKIQMAFDTGTIGHYRVNCRHPCRLFFVATSPVTC